MQSADQKNKITQKNIQKLIGEHANVWPRSSWFFDSGWLKRSKSIKERNEEKETPDHLQPLTPKD